MKCCGISEEDIDLFILKLDDREKLNLFNSWKYDRIIQKVIDFTDITTRLK